MTRLSPYASASATQAVLEAHGLAAKKSLGQNFLVSDNIVGKILDLADIRDDDVALEVGPGIGTLTAALLEHAREVVAVERDADLCDVLADTLAPWRDHLTLVRKDALDLVCEDMSGIVPGKLVANLPYAVAATVVLDYLRRFEFLESATVMVQREVAERMTATPGTKSYGAYTVKLALLAEPGRRFSVSPNNFLPRPHVDSMVVRLDRRALVDDEGAPVSHELADAACTMADAAFANRRKTILNSCKAYFSDRVADAGRTADACRTPDAGRIVQMLPQILEEAGIDASLRGEVFYPDDFVRLGRAYLNAV